MMSNKGGRTTFWIPHSKHQRKNMSAEKDQDTDDAKWRIPHNLGCGTFVQILKALYVQRDDANHATLKRLLSLTSLGKRTLVSNRLYA